MALSSPIEMISNIRHLENQHVAVDNYKREIFEAFTKHVIMPICRKTEEEMRKRTHTVIIPNLKQLNPITERVQDVTKYVLMNDLYLFEKQISIKEEIRHYLSHIFYEMSALSPHDFKTYENMRVFAKEKF